MSFPIIGCEQNASLLAWTTTPWTLPSNVALCVNPKLEYVYVKDPKGAVFVVAEARLESLPNALKKTKGKVRELSEGWTVIKTVYGQALAGLRYAPIFDWFVDAVGPNAFKVCADDYVTSDSGTGVVHQAPAYGEDDYRVCLSGGVVAKGGMLPDPVDANGCFCHPVTAPFAGKHVKEADKELIAAIKDKVC